MNVPLRMHAARTILRGDTGRKRALAALALAAGLLTVGPAQSQQAKPQQVGPRSPLPGRAAAVERAQAEDYLREMKRIAATIPRLMEDARRLADIIRLNCLRDKERQIKRAYNSGRRAYGDLLAAQARGADAERNQQFTKLTVIYQRTTMLGQDAEACVGSDLSDFGTQRLTVDVDDDIRDADDGTARGVTPPLQTDRPFVASPES